MKLLLVLVVLLLMFGGGGYYFGGAIVGASGLGLILLLCALVACTGDVRTKS